MVLSTTYQSCKNLLVSKLNSVGINATVNEGLTTLINKISKIDKSLARLRKKKKKQIQIANNRNENGHHYRSYEYVKE